MATIFFPEEDLEELTVVQLKDMLRQANLTVSGNKADLIKQLQEHASKAEDFIEADWDAFEFDSPRPKQRGERQERLPKDNSVKKEEKMRTKQRTACRDEEKKCLLTSEFLDPAPCACISICWIRIQWPRRQLQCCHLLLWSPPHLG